MPGTDKAARRSGSREPADGELIADRYQLQTRLGRGGMGEVWSARDLRLHRDVAVKVFHGGSGTPTADLPDWLRREGIAAAQIVHPNVAVLYDQGVHRDQIYLVMELVPGATLGDVMRGGRLPLRTALSFAAQIAEALAAAHAARVVHRDIKPHNVLVTPDGTAKVVDFGIAGFLADTRSWTIARVDTAKGSGTPEYAAPEQVLGHNADARSDLYSLGTLLYAMLAARSPSARTTSWRSCTRRPPRTHPRCRPSAGTPGRWWPWSPNCSRATRSNGRHPRGGSRRACAICWSAHRGVKLRLRVRVRIHSIGSRGLRSRPLPRAGRRWRRNRRRASPGSRHRWRSRRVLRSRRSLRSSRRRWRRLRRGLMRTSGRSRPGVRQGIGTRRLSRRC